ncbi:hypothetical protein JTB14_008427 [Gonioctena quinquepunctata]|nr:hypothetical protein JTB14_008427 [Gonioctena quinquepunctata]
MYAEEESLRLRNSPKFSDLFHQHKQISPLPTDYRHINRVKVPPRMRYTVDTTRKSRLQTFSRLERRPWHIQGNPTLVSHSSHLEDNELLRSA